MIEIYPNITTLVRDAVQDFNTHSIDRVYIDSPNSSKAVFEPYLEDRAAFSAMENAGIDGLHNPEMRDLLIGAIRDLTDGIDQIREQRKRMANRLNNPVH